MGNYLCLFICVDHYLLLFIVIDVFGVEKCFLRIFVIIYWCKEVFFVKNIVIIISSINK